MSEELIIRHCSPTLAGMKTGSIFSCFCGSKEEITEYIRNINQRLVPKGIRAVPLRFSKDRALIYLYRPKKLRRDFSENGVRCILEGFGYCCDCPEKCVLRLMEKLGCEDAFPHEIGLFLGYPAEDVQGFIENPKCCKCVGCWKVYGDELSAEKTFKKYKKCTSVYFKQWQNGKSIEKLTVCAG